MLKINQYRYFFFGMIFAFIILINVKSSFWRSQTIIHFDQLAFYQENIKTGKPNDEFNDVENNEETTSMDESSETTESYTQEYIETTSNITLSTTTKQNSDITFVKHTTTTPFSTRKSEHKIVRTTPPVYKTNSPESSSYESNETRDNEFRRIFPLTLFRGSTYKEEQKQRKRHLDSICSKGDFPREFTDLNIKQKKVLLKQFLVCDEYKFIYCFVPKVSCTNWRRVLLVLQNVTKEFTTDKMLRHPPELKFLRSYSEKDQNYRLKNYYKFMFVRNPLERLLSAFRNRLKEVPRVMEKIGFKIKKNYGNYRPPQSKIKTVNKTEIGKGVTFEEYIRWLNDYKRQEDMNSHWAPMHILTQPCLIKYDYIGSFDHLYDDAEVILRAVNAPSHIHFPGRQSYYNPTTYERTIKYYSEVETKYMRELIKNYKKDFSLFSYPVPNPGNLQGKRLNKNAKAKSKL